MRKLYLPGLLIFLWTAVLAAAQQEPMRLPVDPVRLAIDTAAGEAVFDIEIADDASERSRGLMHRTDLPDNRGMLFVYDAPRLISMWMANTPQSLDMVFVGADGRVTAIETATEPFSHAVIAPPVPSRFVIEFKAGIADKHGIAVGNTVRHPRLSSP